MPQDISQPLTTAVSRYFNRISDERLPEKVRDHDLRHMAFWHEYYANTVGALVNNRKPNVLRGTYKIINRDAQLKNADENSANLLSRIEAANTRLLNDARRLKPKAVIPYKVGSRSYLRDDYLETIAHHFDMHSIYLEKIANGAPESFYVFHN